ncbi:MAG: pantetheine-phosphate adenylyltransferase [Eubacteriales bacterium]|nr:pantetheine-phosphate adenylyltransferase [Eubacteriales bacterium]MDD3881366.1 pantetheine-phosphate adenylyltransferase [Eubacteriales bacterium]MDD4513053.1 pantetheine-phosphate adenylyltransferase [Eubacteriales bacterium]
MKRAVYAGSFDPFTYGHRDILRRATALFDEVIVAVLHNPEKRCCLPVTRRMAIIEDSIKGMENVRVSSFSGLLVDYLRKEDIHFCIRGVRNGIDMDSEMQTAHINHQLGSDMGYAVETIALFTSPETSYISGSMVRQIASFGGDVTSYASPEAQKALYEYYHISEGR